jgi:hypothetical protein
MTAQGDGPAQGSPRPDMPRSGPLGQRRATTPSGPGRPPFIILAEILSGGLGEAERGADSPPPPPATHSAARIRGNEYIRS